MRSFLGLLALVTALSAPAATVTFVTPLDGSQVLGPQALEVTTDAVQIDRVEFLVDGVLAGFARKPPYRAVFDFGTSLAPRTVVAKVWSHGYKTVDSATIRTAPLTANDSINVDLVEVPLRVRAGARLQGTDLRVVENGVEQAIREVRAERPPAHFAFVLDRSLSMGGGRLPAALRAIQSEMRQLRAGDTASLVVFNHGVAKARPIGAGDNLTRMFADIVPSGGTSLRDALASVSSRDRTYALVITDGGDRNSALSEEAALRRISGTKTVVSAIVLGDSHARFLDRAAENTGGTVVTASKGTLARELSRLIADINSRYLVVYQSSATRSGWRSIDVRPRTTGVEVVSARKGYFAE